MRPRVSARGRRAKGNKAELDFAKLVGGKRVFASGKFKNISRDLSEDVVLPNGWRTQVKTLRDGWKTLYTYLETADLAALRANNKEFLVVLPVARFLELLDAAAQTPRL